MEFGITQTEVDDNSFLYARIPANTDKEIPSLAFLHTWTPVRMCREIILNIS